MKISKKYSFALLLIIPLLLFVLSFAFKPAFQRICADFFHPYIRPLVFFDKALVNSSVLFLPKRELAGRLAASEAELLKLKAQNRILTELKNENLELRKMLSLKPAPDYFCVPAEILVRDPIFLFESFAIDKGSDSGIKVGSIVLSFNTVKGAPSDYAVVGRIISVAKHSSIVQTIANKNCSFGGFLPEEYLPCIIEGRRFENGKCYFSINYLPLSETIENSVAVSTSPFSQEIPPYLPVGKTLEEKFIKPEKRERAFYRSLECESYVDLTKTQFVMIMVKK
ncbi:MAG: rod shape-determining protein MreC [Candidatus Nanoarchaeia archaeon]